MEMIAGLAEVRELAWRNSGDIALVVSHSGGKDSMRMFGVLQRELPELQIYCVLGDTGFDIRLRSPRRAGSEFGVSLSLILSR
jgi:3'-phosphoadenosine 5'-phosphosulfate sulfotransferase (PAPS reductase)/FAD synthetase